MATQSKYQVKLHSLVALEDIPLLPEVLQQDLEAFCNSLFVEDPYGCFGLPNHSLKGRLQGCRALEIDWGQISYRLVYRVYEKPAPRRVLILSFAEHDAAYEKATQRKKT